ncbi:MAG: response regulator transcription factor [Blastocatellia bacterium]
MSTGNGSDQILVIGDEAKSARAVARLLQAVGYTTAVVENFDDARNNVAGGRVCLNVIDLSASKISGPYSQPTDWDSGQSLKRQTWANEALAFCRTIRTGSATADLPILVISKSQRAQDKVAALNAGASDYIIKPYQKGELLSRVKVHLRSWRYERDIADRFEELNVLHAVSTVLASSLEPEVLIGGTLSVIAGKAWAGPGVVFMCERDAGLVKVAAVQGVELSDEDHAGLLEIYSRVTPLL